MEKLIKYVCFEYCSLISVFLLKSHLILYNNGLEVYVPHPMLFNTKIHKRKTKKSRVAVFINCCDALGKRKKINEDTQSLLALAPKSESSFKRTSKL